MAFTFDYFSPSDASQYAFFRIPKMLITDSRFRCISMEAKLLYGILLDRVSLSVDHGWVDEKNHVYIIYTIEQVMSDMNCSNRKAIGLLKELEQKLGLIEKKRQGLGKPNLLYVKNFFTVCEETADPEVINGHFSECNSVISGNDEEALQDMTKGHGIKTDTTKTDSTKTDLILSDMDADEAEYREIHEYLKESLGIEAKIHDTPYRKDTILGILDLLTDICCTKKKVLYICGEARPASIVKSRLMKLNSGHLEYVLKCLDENKTQVKNIRQYMLAILYNAPTTIGPFHRAWANHDMDSGRYYQGGDNDNE